ncbi:MAG: glycoside hydrolase family 97 catalytic domain-containing protein, partial [Bacteroidales bacterium]|nr:glycoside hydrolase family 97 catalytic domain-containing protein [Bacteroidales bacterium]
WIKPGKVAWDWFNALNIYGVDFESGLNTDTYKYYIDFASKFEIPYIILDEGWSDTEDLFSVNPDIDLPGLFSYAESKNVGIILWVVWNTLDRQLAEALEKFEAWGVKGIKVDFMQRDDQIMVNYYEKIAVEAANHHLIVDFHGSYKPTGLCRTYPNVITREGVHGLENNKWAESVTPEHNVTLPFTRMLAGPMDYTPGAMINCTEKQFKPIFSRPMSQGTRCHQLAMYVIYESPLQMLADSPSNYYKEPETMKFLKQIPVTWDETKVLDAKIGDYIIIARQKNNKWYLGAMTDWIPRDFEIDLSFLDDGEKQITIWKDGVNADKNPLDLKTVKSTVVKNEKIKIQLASGGGWVAVIE